MRLLWLSWKDSKHPLAGGAEKVTHNLLKQLVKDGHEVTLLTSRPKGSAAIDAIDGYKIIRGGSRFTVYLAARKYYKQHLHDWPDVVIDEINTIPFFAQKYTTQPTFIFIHQLARKVWFYEMTWPLSWVGYWLEPLYLRTLRNQKVMTISESTKQELISVGHFNKDAIAILREGSELQPIKDLQKITKYDTPTLLSLGAMRPMKRTGEVVKAFNYAKGLLPELKLVIAGDNSDPYAQEVFTLIKNSPYEADITVLGRVPLAQKQELMAHAHLIAVTSVKEGWGLIVTEANSQGTPAAVYNVDGLRDVVHLGETGLLTPEDPKLLGQSIAKLLKDPKKYKDLRQKAWESSKQYTFENTYADFMRILDTFLK